MLLPSTIVLLLILTLCSAHPRRRCTSNDSCWPSPPIWDSFNASISGRLIASLPSAAVCHRAHYSANLCLNATQAWNSSFWRTSQVGAYAAILWELGDDQCFIDAPVDAPCGPGRVPHFSVAAQGVEDIQKAVKFASEKDLYLVIKNTGHSHLGRSSGTGAFSIWTHNMKGREWHDEFVAKGAPEDVYRDAAKHNVIVVGGSARTVGAAGGYLTGGGHSVWSHFYGLAVDNLLEATIVTATGSHKTLNPYTDPSYFYAIRGGGGNAWGVITSATYKTHPSPTHIQVGLLQFNATTPSSLRLILQRSLALLPDVTNAGYTGYGSTDPTGFSAIFIQPNGNNETFTDTFAPFYNLTTLPGVSGVVANLTFPTWIDYCNTFLRDPNIATNVIDSTRLLTSDVLRNRNKELVDLVLEFPDSGAGFNFSPLPPFPSPLSSAANSKHSRAIMSFGVDWADDAPISEKRRKKMQAVEFSKRLEGIVGREGAGTYVNEANPYEPDWKNVFWGEKYERLLGIKRRVDPKGVFVCNSAGERIGTTMREEMRVLRMESLRGSVAVDSQRPVNLAPSDVTLNTMLTRTRV
ncbi:FAD-binding domain-containing protein [Wilcoxina mikolae CBS 423.85]|nr:FAD-binding domain-containing protein [Wilcoxina mikolae CBS 423.85]